MTLPSEKMASLSIRPEKVDSTNDIIPFRLCTLSRHSDNRYIYFSCLFLSLSDNIYFSMFIVSYANHNHSEFREIVVYCYISLLFVQRLYVSIKGSEYPLCNLYLYLFNILPCASIFLNQWHFVWHYSLNLSASIFYWYTSSLYIILLLLQKVNLFLI